MDRLSRWMRAVPLWTLVAATAALFGAVLWVIATAPAIVAFLLMVAIAACWCVWLERHPGEQC